jgi:hypothetical protein
MSAEWVRTHTVGGRIIGEFASSEHAQRPMAVVMTLHGPEIVPRDSLIPLETSDVIDSLAHSFEDVIDAAERVGYTLEAIQAAVALALQRRAPTRPQ